VNAVPPLPEPGPDAPSVPAVAAVPVAPPAPKASDSPRWWAAIAAVMLVVCVLAIAIAWKAEQRVAGLEQELVRRQQDSSAQSTEARMLARQAQEGMLDAAAKVALLEARVAEVAIQRTQLEDLIQSLSRSRDENLLVDVEAAIRVAVQQGAITGSAEPLVATLRQSDERLQRYNQPRLEGVRRAIARDLDRVKAVGVTDISTLTIKLDETMRLVDDLPLIAMAEARREAARSGAAPAAKPVATPASAAPASRWSLPRAWQEAWSSAWERLWAEARSLVRVSRIDEPDALLLEPQHAFFLRENIKLRLLNARLALLSRQFVTAQADLIVVQSALDRYFDRSSKRTVAAADLVRQAIQQARQIALPRPDDTLAALAAATAGR
jgi:uroporphyrin-III C-methyltransferase